MKFQKKKKKKKKNNILYYIFLYNYKINLFYI